jgi:hypothetical protein
MLELYQLSKHSYSFIMIFDAEESLVFTKDLSDVKITRLPGKAIFECELNRPNVQITWYKDDQPLRKSQRLDIDCEGKVHRLTLKNVDSADEATYTAVVKKAKTAAKLSVQSSYNLISNSLAIV